MQFSGNFGCPLRLASWSQDTALKFWWAYGPNPQSRMAKGSTTAGEYMDLTVAPTMPNMSYWPKDLILRIW